MELTAHLGELRSRIMRSFLFIVLGAILAYSYFPQIYASLYNPLHKEMLIQNEARIKIINPQALLSKEITTSAPSQADYNMLVKDIHYLWEHPSMIPLSSTVFKNFYDPFMGQLTLSLIFGVILSTPFVVWELSLFIIPALTPKERRPFKLLIPCSILLTIAGVYLGYRTMFYAMHWFLSFVDNYPQPAVVMQDPNTYILFFVKLMAVFGIVFQLPVVLMGLAFIGVVTSKGLLKAWRWGIVLAVLGAMFVPSNDYITMGLISVSILFLYYGSFFFVRFVEYLKKRYKELDAQAEHGD